MPKLLAKVRPEAQKLLESHHHAGHATYIVSAAPVEIVEPLAHALGMTAGIGTRAVVDDGVYTGELAGPFCYGPGKVEAIADVAHWEGYDLTRCYAYSDSASDLPMLEAVGHPVAVNPDARLGATPAEPAGRSSSSAGARSRWSGARRPVRPRSRSPERASRPGSRSPSTADRRARRKGRRAWDQRPVACDRAHDVRPPVRHGGPHRGVRPAALTRTSVAGPRSVRGSQRRSPPPAGNRKEEQWST